MIVPKKRSLYRYAVDTFIDLLGQVQKRSTAYRCNDIDTTCWNKFVDIYSDRGLVITKEFVKNFCEYGIQSWFNKDVEDEKKGRVRFNWVFSEKAIKRWDAMGAQGRKWAVRVGLKTDYNIKYKNTESSDRLKTLYTSIRPIEENFKKEYFNGLRGLSWCIANTSLYFHKSSFCVACKYKVECKEILRQNYSKIYKIRGYKDNE